MKFMEWIKAAHNLRLTITTFTFYHNQKTSKTETETATLNRNILQYTSYTGFLERTMKSNVSNDSHWKLIRKRTHIKLLEKSFKWKLSVTWLFLHLTLLIHWMPQCNSNFGCKWKVYLDRWRNRQIYTYFGQTNISSGWYNWKLFVILYYAKDFIERCIKLFLHVTVGSGRYK